MIASNIDDLANEAGGALREINAEINRLREERKSTNVRIAELDLERRRIKRIVNAFKPRPARKVADNGESE